jgi:anaerobic magnesium-protoporphyrin IX monomethyl ester cyclase
VADVLLTHSYHLPYDRKQVRKMQPYPPLGTLYAASVLRARGISVAVFDTMLQDPLSGFVEALARHRPKIVAIYEDDFNFLSKMCLTRMREVAWQIAEMARSAGAAVISHGSDASDHISEYLCHGSNAVLLGEAETTLAEVCSSALRQSGETRMAGLGTVIRASNADGAAQWLTMPSPARDLIDLDPYQKLWKAAHGYFSLNLVASRGCPFHCNWCAKPISGNRFHVRPAKLVANELRDLNKLYEADHAWFGDDVFALDHRWAREFADAMQNTGCHVPFKIQTRADLLSAETARNLKRAGCSEVWMGVESGSQKVLDSMDKGLRVEEVISARSYLKQEGIRACFFLQLGYPGETWNDIKSTVALLRDTRPDDIGVSISYPLPNTRFHEQVRAQLGQKRNWTDSDDLCVMFKGAYTDEFYLAVRDALHAEVEAWNAPNALERLVGSVYKLWCEVERLEPLSRNPDATVLRTSESGPANTNGCGFVAAHELGAAREA